jgi:hypothetical protein
MGIKCIMCNADNPPDSVFCENCGARLDQSPPPKPKIESPPSPPPPPTPSYVISFKGNSLEVNELKRVFGRNDFVKVLAQHEFQYISKAHFTISNENGKFYIQDGAFEITNSNWKDSTNGTTLNGEQIQGAGKKELKDNDKIMLAATLELQFNIKK